MLISVALHPVPNAAFLFVLAILLRLLNSFFATIVVLVVASLLYVVVGPCVRRSKAMWNIVSPPRPVSEVTRQATKDSWRYPMVVMHHGVANRGRQSIAHALSLNTAALDGAVFCVPPSRRFHYALCRLLLRLVGGIVPYSRGVLINLLRRKTQNGPIVVVAPVSHVTASTVEISLEAKGIFAAALRTGAAVTPCLTLEDGHIHFGQVIPGVDPEETPATDDVVALARRYARAVEELYAARNTVRGRTITVSM